MTEPFAMVRMTTKDIIYLASQWENSPGSGPGSYKQFWKACLEAGAYVPVNDQSDYYWFHPEKLGAAGEMLKNGTDAYIAAGKQNTEASNVTCLWHRKKMHDGRHADDSICGRPPRTRTTATEPASSRRGGRTA